MKVSKANFINGFFCNKLLKQALHLEKIKLHNFTATVGMFDWRLFDNSNRTKVVRRPKKLGCSTQIMFDGKLTIVEHKINRTKSEI